MPCHPHTPCRHAALRLPATGAPQQAANRSPTCIRCQQVCRLLDLAQLRKLVEHPGEHHLACRQREAGSPENRLSKVRCKQRAGTPHTSRGRPSRLQVGQFAAVQADVGSAVHAWRSSTCQPHSTVPPNPAADTKKLQTPSPPVNMTGLPALARATASNSAAYSASLLVFGWRERVRLALTRTEVGETAMPRSIPQTDKVRSVGAVGAPQWAHLMRCAAQLLAAPWQ